MRFKEKLYLSANHILHSLVQMIAIFTIFNIILRCFSPAYDGNWIWISLRFLPKYMEIFILLFFSVGILFVRHLPQRVLPFMKCFLGLIAIACLYNAYEFYVLLFLETIRSSFPVPSSLIIGILIGWWAILLKRHQAHHRHFLARAGLTAVSWSGCAILLLLLQIFSFGNTDYRRPANAILVFGAKAHAEDKPSLVLQYRVLKACEVYRQGYASMIILSGGIDPNNHISEPQTMKKIALEQGIPEKALILDEQGNNTIASVANAARIAHDKGWRRLIMVSDDYHLSRIKFLSYRFGLKVYTVPSSGVIPKAEKMWYVIRELTAWCFYYIT